jgi:hypothetical protein
VKEFEVVITLTVSADDASAAAAAAVAQLRDPVKWADRPVEYARVRELHVEHPVNPKYEVIW